MNLLLESIFPFSKIDEKLELLMTYFFKNIPCLIILPSR
jgi:hypothetical protein